MQTIPARSISSHPSGGTGLHPSGGTGLLTLETRVLTSTKDEAQKRNTATANNTCPHYLDTSVLTSMEDEAQKIFSADADNTCWHYLVTSVLTSMRSSSCDVLRILILHQGSDKQLRHTGAALGPFVTLQPLETSDATDIGIFPGDAQQT